MSTVPQPPPLPHRPDALLLDLDGTLSASGPVITAGIRHALRAVDGPALSEDVLRSWLGPPLVDSFAALPGFDADRAARAVAAYRAAYDPLAAPLFDGVLELLAAVRADGVAMALATSKPQRFAEQVVTGKGLDLDVVVGWDDAVGRLTKADCVGEALRQLGGPARPVMVGDRVHDVVGAAAHGVPCVGVLWGYGDREELHGAALLVERPEQVRWWA